ncbi:hypothetical protein BH09ACT5_BH09ACT5_00700 [soil metagenome]
MANLSLLTIGLATAFVAGGLAAGSAGCSQFEINSGACVTATAGDQEVVLEGSDSWGDSGAAGGSDTSAESAVPDLFVGCGDPVSVSCVRPFVATVSGPASDPVSLGDLESFRPDAVVARMEPSGWAVLGLDANFFGVGGVQVKEGVLLGRPAQVRFTPVSWSWSYGDGAVAQVGFPGRSWEQWGVAEFDATGTSHVYQQRGVFVVGLVVGFEAEYRFAGGPWVPVVGRVAVPSAPLEVVVGRARTVLVARDCNQDPHGPGC